MEQETRFCTTSDGVRIAYSVYGEGPAVVRCFGWFTHIEYEWTLFGPQIAMASQASGVSYVRYDGRGMGLSDRNVDDLSLEGQVRDVEAVVDALRLESFTFSAISQGGPTSIAYACRHPERVKSIAFLGSFAKVPWTAEVTESFATIALHGWGQDSPAFRQMFTGLFYPEAEPEFLERFTELQRQSATPETASTMIRAIAGYDVRDLLSEVNVPVLVGHRRGDSVVPFEAGRELAMGIRDARLVALEGRNHAFAPHEMEEAMKWGEAFRGFLAETLTGSAAEPSAPAGTVSAASGLVTLLFTDMESSTTTTHKLGDARAQELLHEHDAIVRQALERCGGRRIKHTGDGVMASFGSAVGAVECAVEIQRSFDAYNAEHAELPIRVRVGLNAGEPIAEDDDFFGTAVIVASRIADRADPGEILVSDVVRQLVAGKGFRFEERGHCVLKGFDEAVNLFAVQGS